MNKTDAKNILENSYFIQQWKNEQIRNLQLKYPNMNCKKVEKYLDKIIQDELYNPYVTLENNYLNKIAHTDLLSIVDFIQQNKPIIGGNGVLFYQHAQAYNPMLDWIINIMAERSAAKSNMYQYEVGSEIFNELYRNQLSLKIIINSLYGGFGYRGFIFANIFLSTSVTMLGQTTISAAAMGFEAFLSNNAPFVEENEIYRFIDFVKQEAYAYEQMDKNAFAPFHAVSDDEIIKKIISCCTFKVPKEVLNSITQMIQNLNDHEKILLYFKNNLYAFCDTPIMHDALRRLHKMIKKLLAPAINKKLLEKSKEEIEKVMEPSEKLPEIIEEIDFIWNMMYTFVVFDHPIYDRVRKNKYTYKKSVAYQDTDSNFIILDPWVKYIKEKIIPDEVSTDQDEIKNLDFKIVNLMTIFVTKIVACSFATLCNSLNIDAEHSKRLGMKNEVYYSRMLFPNKKKRYIGKQELKEGKIVKGRKGLDIKGFDFIKATTKPSIRKVYEDICFDDILTAEKIDIEKIFMKVFTFEQEMKNALRNGDTQYFKQANLKMIKEYANPYSIQGIKGVLLWNTLAPEYAIQLPTDVDIVPITLENARRKTLAKIGEKAFDSVWRVPYGVDEKTGRMKIIDNSGKEMINFSRKYPEEFSRLQNNILLNQNNAIRSMGLNCIAKPKNVDIVIPQWFYDIMDTDKIINDALSLFHPIMKSLDIKVFKTGLLTEHYSNIVSL